MKRLGTLLGACCICAISLPVGAWGQSDRDTDREKQAQAMEKQAEHWEQWAEQHEHQFEEWAEQYSKQWEHWAKQFESHMEQWAANQEEVWEDWADKYSHRWEEWGKAIENQELDTEQLHELLQHNLEMLGDMPLGQMIDKGLKEGTEGLADAPWESLGELQEMINGSLKQSLQQLEELDLNDVNQEEMAQSVGKLREAIEKMQSGLDTKRDRIRVDAESQLTDLKNKLEMSTRALRDDPEARAKAAAMADKARAVAMKHLQEAHKARAEAASQAAKARQAKEGARSQADADYLKEMFRELSNERKNIEVKNDELDSLRKEIQQLRDEIRRLKRSKDRDDG